MKNIILITLALLVPLVGIAQVGTRDPTFNSAMLKYGNGTGLSSSVYAIAIQSDGKILIGGAFTTYNGTTANLITRLNSDGSINATFNPAEVGANSTVTCNF